MKGQIRVEDFDARAHDRQLRSKETRAQIQAIRCEQERHKQPSAAEQRDHLQYIGLGFGVRYAVQSLDKCSHGDLQNPASAEAG